MTERRKLSQVPLLDSPKIMEYNYSYIQKDGFTFDPYELIFDWGSEAIRVARSVQPKYSRQYRKFNVGATLLGNNVNRQHAALFPGATTKLQKKDPKYCAEMQAKDNASRRGFKETIGAFVVGTADVEKISGVLQFEVPTLYPCEECTSGFLDKSTVVVSVNDDADRFEAQTGSHLADLYDKPKSYIPSAAVLNSPGFALFSTAKALYLAQAAEMGPYSPDTRPDRAEAVVRSLRDAA